MIDQIYSQPTQIENTDSGANDFGMIDKAQIAKAKAGKQNEAQIIRPD